MKNDNANPNETSLLLPLFGSHFLEDHAKTIISDPKIALIELIANCWDAGANRVDITWPKESRPELIEVKDDGTGMTAEEFSKRWRELNYNRKEIQGDEVIFPMDNRESKRKAYGTNGKGRHSMFCFSNTYQVETWRDGISNVFMVSRILVPGKSPFEIKAISTLPKVGHGTIISAELARNYLDVSVVRDLIGSKFVVDPGFIVYVRFSE